MTSTQGTAAVSFPATKVDLALGFYPVRSGGELTINGGKLLFVPKSQMSQRERPTIKIAIDSATEVSTDKWPHPLIGVLLWVLIPWSVFTYDKWANLNITSQREYHFCVGHPEEIARVIGSMTQ